jgi:hypothetical protein
VLVALIGSIAAVLVVPEVRRVLGLGSTETVTPAPIIDGRPVLAPKTPQQTEASSSDGVALGDSSKKRTPPTNSNDDRTTSSVARTKLGAEVPTENVTETPTATKLETENKRGNAPSFDGDTYRVTAESLRRTGRTAALILGIEGLDDKTVRVRICGWYLLDENGDRWDEDGEDSAGLCDGAGGGVDVRVGIKLKTKLAFKPKEPVTGREPASGREFTAMGSQLTPWPPGTQVVITGIILE